MDSTSHPDYFRNIPEYSRRFLRGGDGYRRKCCGYIYYVKLVTDAAACKYPNWDCTDRGVWPKGEYGKGEYGKETFRADQFCILDTNGQWLGR